MRQAIQSQHAPAAIGSYSQAIKSGQTIYLSGQIALDPQTKNFVNHDITAEINQVFTNLKAVAEAAGGSLNEVVKLSVFLTDLNNLALVNDSMTNFFNTPFPARTSIEVSALPKGARVEVDAIIVLNHPAP